MWYPQEAMKRGRGAIRRGWLVAALAALVGPGCAEPAWQLEGLELRHPALRARSPHRLGDTTPYYLPAAGHLTLFLCRWLDGATVPVSLPANATPEQRRKLEAVLGAWEDALGLSFELRELSGVGIEIRLFDDMLAYAANTVADCAIDVEALAAGTPDVLPARLVFASIQMARDDPRLAGTALHELGHALGFQGHASRGRTVMVTATDAVRLAGERAVAGKPFDDAAVGALYAVPSGSVLARLPLARQRTSSVDRLIAIGRRRGWIGPLVRVGDEEGRIAWFDPQGRAVSLRLSGLRQALRNPSRLAIEPSARARQLLEAEP
jgi:hypothetical protein